MTRTQTLCGIAAACLTLMSGAALASTSLNGSDQSAGQTPTTLAVTALPQAAPNPTSQRPMSQRLGRQRVDADARLSRAEFVEARLRPLVAMDADSDGTVSVAERTTWREARMNERATRQFARLDADSNGMVSRAEFDAARQKASSERGERRAARTSAPPVAGEPSVAMRAHRGSHRHGAMAARGRQGADRTSSRSAQPEAVSIAEARARAEATFTRLDLDADGFISRAERQAMRGEIRQRSSAGREGRSLRRQVRVQPDPTSASPAMPASE